MKRLPDGTYQISNSVTGETKVVKPEELSKYGLSAPDAPAVQQQAPVQQTQQSVQVTQPAVQAPEQQVRKQGLLDKIGSGAMNLGSSVVKGIAKPAQMLGESLSGIASNKMQQDANANLAFLAKKAGDDAIAAGKAGDPEKAARLFKMSQETAAQASQGFDQQSKDLETNKKKYAKGLAGTAATALSAIPAGSAGAVANIATGTTLGAAQGYSGSDDGNELTSTIGGGVLGGGLSAIGEGIGLLKAKKAAGNAGKNALTKSGEEIEQGIRQIKVKPSVGGAQQEQRINQVLDDLDIKGTPQQQYTQLQPKMNELEGKIRPMLQQNSQSFAPAKVQSDILDVLDKQGLLVGNKAKATANQALNDVMSDVVNKGQKGVLTSEDLFDVKQKLNTIGQRLSDKVEKGIAISPEDEVLLASRDALDNVISAYHPEVKDLTMQQSALFDAAKPLSAARNNPPTLRAAGFSIPANVTIKGQQLAGGALQTAGNVLQGGTTIGGAGVNAVQNVASNPLTMTGISALSRVQNSADQTQQPQSTLNQNNGQDNSQNQVKQGMPPVGQDAIANGSSIASPAAQAKPLNQYGLSIPQLRQLHQMAVASGDTKAANQVNLILKDEVENQKAQGGSGSKLTATASKDLGDIEASHDLVGGISEFINQYKGKMGPVVGRLTTSNPYDTDAQAFQAQMSMVAQAVGKSLEGGKMTDKDVPKYEKMLPKMTDTPEVAQRKIKNVQKMLEDRHRTLKQYYQNSIPDTGLVPIDQLGGIGNDGVGQ